MKLLVNALDSLVRRLPWLVIIVALVITMVMGAFAGQFAPADNDNDSFAPDAEELLAVDEINALFGEESSQSVMQVIISSDSGDVITLDGLATVDAVRSTVLAGALAPFLIDQPGTGPIVHYLTPVEFALDNGAPVPTTDPALKAIYGTALADPDAPPELTGLATGLLPESADISTASSPSGLLLVFSTGAASTDQADVDIFADASGEAAAEIAATEVPEGITVEPFSFELLFSDTSEFEAEISRLFATAGFIILLVLSIIFLVRPKTRGDKWLAVIGFVALVFAVGVLILPSLATLFPDAFPQSIRDLEVEPVLALAGLTYAIVYLLWASLLIPVAVAVVGAAAVGLMLGSNVASGVRSGAGVVVFIVILVPLVVLQYRRQLYFPRLSPSLRRTSADTLVTILAIVMAILWMQGYGYLRFTEASGLVQILPILLIGLGVDYSIHMNSRYREEVSGGSTVDNGISRAIRTVGVALVLATVTTAVGFLTNIFNDLAALREFGELAAFGIIVSFLLMLTFVPAIRLLVDRFGEKRDHIDPESLRGGESRRLPRLIGKASWLPRNAAIATLVVSVILGILGAWGTVNIEAKFSFLDFIPTTSPLRNTFATLLDEYGGGFGETTQVLICDFDQPEGADSPSCTDAGAVDTADAWNGMVAATNGMGDIDDVIKFGDFPAAQSPVSLYFQLANPESDLFDPAVGEAAQAAGIGADGMAAAGADIAPVYDAMFVAAPDEASAVLFDAGRPYTAALFAIQTQGGEQGAAQLQEDLIEAFSGVSATGLSVIATSTEIISEIIITTLRDSQLQSLLLTLVAALILLVVNFTVTARRPMLGLITTVPVVLVVLLSFALMTLFKIPFGPVTATISALAIGIGIPYMIHITHRYEEDRARSATENDAIEDTLVHTGGALAGSALTTIAGFGILVTSSTIPFRQFGFVTAYTILLALLAAVLILPSYLVIWDRWHRNRGEDPIDAAAYEAAMQEQVD